MRLLPGLAPRAWCLERARRVEAVALPRCRGRLASAILRQKRGRRVVGTKVGWGSMTWCEEKDKAMVKMRAWCARACNFTLRSGSSTKVYRDHSMKVC
jgi:hypothetical protein